MTSTKHEAIKVLDKGKQIIQEPALAPIVLPIQAAKSTYEQGESSCNSLEKLSQPLSIISPIPSPAGTLAPQASHDNMMSMLPSVFPYNKTNTPNEDDDTMAESADFDGVVQQVNQAKYFLKHKIKASANWFTSWTSPVASKPTTLFTIAANLRSYATHRSRHATLQSNVQQRITCT